MLPLEGIRILDFSTLVPGPLATLILTEAGADVIKIERPGGEDLRRYPPFLDDGASAYFALLNRGKRAVAADLKSPEDLARVLALAAECDVLVEQFRPGVMARLGLGYEALRRSNPRLVYCSISGFGQTGGRAAEPAHDLNYLARTGLLALGGDATGAPVLPQVPLADIGGGTFPAILNILLALRTAEATGRGQWIDIAMAEGSFFWQPWVQAQIEVGQGWPQPGRALLSGGSPRYALYRTADGRYLAAAPLEEHFWRTFCDAVGLPDALRDDRADPEATRNAIAGIIAARTSADWTSVFAGCDLCCTVVANPDDARQDPEFAARGVFARRLQSGGQEIAALPVPLAEALRYSEPVARSPDELTPIGALPASPWKNSASADRQSRQD